MDAIQEKYFQMLCEIDDLCREADIRYYLSFRSALQGFVCHEVPDGHFNPSVLIRAEDVKAFTDAFERVERPNRVLESMLNNGHFPSYSLKYTDTESLCINVRQLDNFKVHGLHVVVGIIEHMPNKYVRKLGNAVKHGWYDNNYPYGRSKSLSWRVSVPKALMKPLMIANRDFVGRTSFKGLTSIYSRPSKGYQFSHTNMAYYKINASWVNREPYMVEIEGREFPMLSNPRAYLKGLYGAKYATIAWATPKENIYRVVDPYIPFERFRAENPDLFNMDKFAGLIAENNRLNRLNEPFHAEIEKKWRAARFVGRKIELKERYEEYLAEYDSLIACCAYDTLYKRLLPYIRHILGNCYGMEPFFNDHLSDLCRVTLSELDKKVLLKKLDRKLARYAVQSE